MNEQYHTPFEDLLVKYLLQEASPAEVRQVEEWLSADPANQRYYDEVRLIWQQSLKLSRTQPPDKENEEEEAWQKLRKNLRTPGQRRPAILYLRWTVAAAAVLLPVALITFIWKSISTTGWQKTATAETIRTDTLADGSIVTLNKHSSLSQRKGDRSVVLDGEAFFRIAPDASKPFHVNTGKVTITVLGTSFNVRSHAGSTDITVETGLISVSNGRNAITVAAGETISAKPNDSILQKHQAPIELHEYYRPRDFECNDTPLWQLVDALNEAYDVHIIITNPALKNKSINTTFHNEDLDRILSILGETLNAKVERTNANIILH